MRLVPIWWWLFFYLIMCVTDQDINIRLHKHPQVNHRTIVQNDFQWKLHQVCSLWCELLLKLSILQILDASNHLVSALNILDTPPLRFNDKNHKFDFKTADEVVSVSILLEFYEESITF